MKKQEEFFLKCIEEWRDGYLIPVRNRMGNMIEREYLPSELREPFELKFKQTIIYDNDFLDWYCSMKKSHQSENKKH